MGAEEIYLDFWQVHRESLAPKIGFEDERGFVEIAEFYKAYRARSTPFRSVYTDCINRKADCWQERISGLN